jgi:hypothetical protein
LDAAPGTAGGEMMTVAFIAGILVGGALCSVFWIIQKQKQGTTDMLEHTHFVEIQTEPVITLKAESTFAKENIGRYGDDTVSRFARESVMRKITDDLENYVRFETYEDPYSRTITLRGSIRVAQPLGR